MEASKHTFEMSGLGKGPYTLVTAAEASEDTRNGVFWCEHCGTTLRNRYFVRSSTGVYVIGVDCANKSGEQGIIDGIKRQIREEKAKLRMEKQAAQWEVKRSAELAAFKEAHGGKLPSQVANELETAFKTKRTAWIDALDNGEHAIVTDLRLQGSTFAGSMHLQAYCGEPYSIGQASVIKEIVAKKRSGARKKSKAYLAAMPAIEAELETLQAKLAEYNTARQVFEREFDAVNLLKDWEQE